ncbi:MAG: FAD-dependent oxidoreductase [Synechococcus sp.]|nr:FAD-dependent oxidoreductase [Synechococcus sp.]
MPAGPPLLLVGGGLCGALLALELAERGAAVELAGPPLETGASGCSYGGVPWWAGADDPLGRLQAQAPSAWQQLQQRHGPLGLQPLPLWLHWQQQDDLRAVQAAMAALQQLPQQPAVEQLNGAELQRAEPLMAGGDWAGALQLPYLRLDPRGLQRGLDVALERLGVHRSPALSPEVLAQRLRRDSVVLCAGAATVGLLQGLGLSIPGPLRFSWAGVLKLERAQLAAPRIAMPLLGQRRQRELAAVGDPSILDAGVAPAPGGGLLLGQTSWFEQPLNPAPQAAQELERLQAAAQQLLPGLASEQLAAATLQQQPVAYSTDQRPLLGPHSEQPQLHLFTGFSGAFAQVPVLAPLLAEALLSGQWQTLQPLGVLHR